MDHIANSISRFFANKPIKAVRDVKDSDEANKEYKVLILGTADSGKTTILNQMKIINSSGFSEEELSVFRSIIYKNILDSAQAIVLHMRKLGLAADTPSGRLGADRIIDYRLDESNGQCLNWDIANAMSEFWRDPVAEKILNEHSSEFYLMDSATYFLSEVLRIGSPDYMPTQTDVLRAYRKTIGINCTQIQMGELSLQLFDVGGVRSERKKCCLVCYILRCAALSEYDQVLTEDRKQNRLTESLVLFESVLNSKWFIRSSIILFLNKTDVFKSKIPKIPLSLYLPEYTGGSDINKAAKHILWRFMQTNRARLRLYPHLTQATDTVNVRQVFETVTMQNALRISEVL